MRLIEVQRDGLKHADGRRMWPGAYRVPADVPEDLAARLVASGDAIDLKPKTPATRPVGRWHGSTVVIAATGPSLTDSVCDLVHEALIDSQVPPTPFPLRVIAVNDAYRMMPWADVLYACDAKWWDHHKPNFAGEKWSARPWDVQLDRGDLEDAGKDRLAAEQGVQLIEARLSDAGLSNDPTWITYGSNSLVQAIGLAWHWIAPAGRVILVGADMRTVGKGKNAKRHFFGDHPEPLSNAADFRKFVPAFDAIAKRMPAGLEIINATPDSAVKCFPEMTLADALAD